jgi:hypothetical protein
MSFLFNNLAPLGVTLERQNIDSALNSFYQTDIYLAAAGLKAGLDKATVARAFFYDAFNDILLAQGEVGELTYPEENEQDVIDALTWLSTSLYAELGKLTTLTTAANTQYNYVPCELGYTCAGGDAAPAVCPLGWYTNEMEQTTCKQAERNHQIVFAGALRLRVGQVPCPNGTSSGVGSDECGICGFGSYSAGGDCLDCVPGKYSNTSAAAACLDCPAGSETDKAANGQGAEATNAVSCTPCKAGTFSTASNIACADCPEGFFQGSGSKTECVRPVQASIRVCEGRTDACRNATVAYNGTYTTNENEHAVEDSTGGSHVPDAGSTKATANSDCNSTVVETTVPSASADRVCGDGRPTQSVTIHYSEIIV